MELWQDVKICLECLIAFVVKATAMLKKQRDAQVNNKKPFIKLYLKSTLSFNFFSNRCVQYGKMHIGMMILNEQVNVKFCVSLEYEIQV